MKWMNLRSDQIGKLPRDTVVVLPVASIEQHGPHLPTGTDSMIAQGIVDALDAARGGQVLILPVQCYGCSAHHMGFPGTVTIEHETFKAIALEAVGSAIQQGFQRVLIVNAHGGNNAVGTVISQKAAAHWPQAEVAFACWFALGDRLASITEGGFPRILHACEFETSLMLHLHPELVDMSRAEDAGVVNAIEPRSDTIILGGEVSLSLAFHRLSHNGAIGRPTVATAEKGRRTLQIAVDTLIERIDALWPGRKSNRKGTKTTKKTTEKKTIG